jgi:protein-tyrosine phosphatase
MMRRIPLSTAGNMRDLGGYPVTGGSPAMGEALMMGEALVLGGHPALNGRFTQYGRIFRSDCPSTFTDEDMAWMRRLDIRTVIDMRSKVECEEVPSAYRTIPGVAYHRCPFTIGANYPETEQDIPNTYLAMFADEENMARILAHIAAAEGAVVFHCVAGKDRTGVVAATLLTMAGVPFDDVLADYQVSRTYLREFLRERRASHPDMPEWAGRSESWYLEQSLGELLRRDKGIDSYLDRLGLSMDQRQAILMRLLGSDPG